MAGTLLLGHDGAAVSRDKWVHELSSEALFRLQLVSAVVVRLERGERPSVVIAEVASDPLLSLAGQPRQVSERTLRRWVQAYRSEGPAGLEPRSRERVVDSACLRPAFVEFLKLEKRLDPEASLPEIIARARLKGVVGPEERIDRTSVWRAARRLGLPLTRPGRLRDTDMRRFAYTHRMQLVLVDGKRFRAGIGRLRRVALVFLDDATRYGLEVLVGPEETAELFLHALYGTVRHFGLMRALYADRGGGFTGDDSRQTVVRLGIHFIFGTAGYPEGHGKIEAFNKTFKNRCLRGVDRGPEVDPSYGALKLRLSHWLHTQYNQTPHEGLGGLTPAECWQQDERPLEFPAERRLLDEAFVLSFRRRVSKDNIISHDGTDYEVPRGYSGSWLVVHRHLLEQGKLTIRHRGKRLELHPVDLSFNAYSRRSKRPPKPHEESERPTRTAANQAFDNDFPPLVDADGGYIGDEDDE